MSEFKTTKAMADESYNGAPCDYIEDVFDDDDGVHEVRIVWESDWQRIERLLSLLPRTADGAFIAECSEFFCPTCGTKLLPYGSECMVCPTHRVIEFSECLSNRPG